MIDFLFMAFLWATALLISRLLRVPQKISRTLALRSASDVLVVHWANRRVIGRNWGDKLNPVLCRMLSGLNVVHAYDVFSPAGKPEHYVIGSSLARAQARGGVVWGAGFIHSGEGRRDDSARLLAVRGHFSRERLRELGRDCPATVGDPALLMPRLYRPRRIGRRYRVGVVAHCYEQGIAHARENCLPEDFLAIDVTGDLFEFIDRICACDEILSSSLHGLICADAYGVASRWIKLSDRPAGDGFKFHDYYSSIGKTVAGPAAVESADDWTKLVGRASPPVDRRTLGQLSDRLLAVCPFTPGNACTRAGSVAALKPCRVGRS